MQNSSSSMVLRCDKGMVKGGRTYHLQRTVTARATSTRQKEFPFLPLTTWTASTTLCTTFRNHRSLESHWAFLPLPITPRLSVLLPVTPVRDRRLLAKILKPQMPRSDASRSEARSLAQRQNHQRKMVTRRMIALSSKPEKTRSENLTLLGTPSRNPKHQAPMLSSCSLTGSRNPRLRRSYNENLAISRLHWQHFCGTPIPSRWTLRR